MGKAKYRFALAGKRIYSRNFWDGGKTKQARNWRYALARADREGMEMIFSGIKMNLFSRKIFPPYTITIIRVYPTIKTWFCCAQKIYDDDNMSGGCKHIRDGIAKGLGYENDNHPDLSWEYAQVKTYDIQRMDVIITTKGVKNEIKL